MDYGSSVGERIKNFDAHHGKSIVDGAFIYFENGARREKNPYGAFYEPPECPRQLQERKIYYYKLLRSIQVQKFDERKQQLRRLAEDGHINNPEEDIEELQQLYWDVCRTGHRLKKAETALRRLQPGFETPEAEAETLRLNATQEAYKAAQRSAHLDAINAIEV